MSSTAQAQPAATLTSPLRTRRPLLPVVAGALAAAATAVALARVSPPGAAR